MKYLRIFITITLITLIPLLFITVIVHFYSAVHFRDSYITMKQSQLENVAVAIDEKMLNLDSLQKSLGNNRDVIQFTVSPDVDTYSQNTKIIREMDNYISSNANIASIYIYSRSYGSILSSKNGFKPLHEFEDISWVDQFKKLQGGLPVVITRSREGVNTPTITLMSSIPLRSRDATGAVLINIDERKLYTSIFRNSSEGSSQFVIDNSGVILSHPDSRLIGTNYWNTYGLTGLFNEVSGSHFIQRDGEKLLLSYAKGDYTKWYIVSEEAVTGILGPIRPFILVLMIIVVIAVILILITDMNISRKLYLPLQDLHDIEGKFVEIKPLVEEKILQTILNDTSENRQKLIQDLDTIGLDVSTQLCSGIILEIDNYRLILEDTGDKRLKELKQGLMERIEIALQDPFYEHMKSDTAVNRIALVVFFNTEVEFSEFLPRFSASLQRFNTELTFSVSCAVGAVNQGIDEVSKSFHQAISLLPMKFLQGPGRVFTPSYSFPSPQGVSENLVELKKRFLHYVKLSDRVQAEETIHHLEDTVPSDIKNPLEAKDFYITIAKELAAYIQGDSEDITSHARGEEIIRGVEEQETIGDATKWLSEIVVDIVQLKESKDIDRIDSVAKQILSYIDDNLANKNISLTEIGDAVGLSASYVSKIFKEYCGYNYLEYLNRGRVTRAVTLLEDRSLSIEDVGDMVGFSSTQSFLRVFQKYRKTTPGKYRKNHLEKEVLS